MIPLIQLASLIVISTPLNADHDLHLIHTNEMRAKLEEVDAFGNSCNKKKECFGGFARIAAFIQDHQKENTMVVTCGGSFFGTIHLTILPDEIATAFMKLIGFDVMNFGENDFMFGAEVLQRYLKNVDIPLVASNFQVMSHFSPDLVLEYQNFVVGELVVGVVGYTTVKAKGGLIEGGMDEMLRVLYEPIAVDHCARLAKKHGAKIVIALGTSNLLMDLAIARMVKEVDIIVGSNKQIQQYVDEESANLKDKPENHYPVVIKKQDGRKTLILYCEYDSLYIAEINVKWSDSFELLDYSGACYHLNNTFRKDKNVTKLLASYAYRVKKQASKIIGETLTDLNGNCRHVECSLGNLVTDAMKDYVMSANRTIPSTELIPMALFNSGGIRKGFNVSSHGGNISFADLKRMLPYDPTLMHIRIEGRHILKILEHSLDLVGNGGFLQISGGRMKVKKSKTRLTLVLAEIADKYMNFEQIKRTQLYDLVIPGYLLFGGDDYFYFQDAILVDGYGDPKVFEVVQRYIERKSPIQPRAEGRISYHMNAKYGCGTIHKALSSLLAIITILFFNS